MEKCKQCGKEMSLQDYFLSTERVCAVCCRENKG